MSEASCANQESASTPPSDGWRSPGGIAGWTGRVAARRPGLDRTVGGAPVACRADRRSARSTISRRLPARSGSGSWAMSSGGRS